MSIFVNGILEVAAAAAAVAEQFPAGLNTGGQNNYVLPFYVDNTGSPVRAANVALVSVNNVKVITYSRAGGVWYHKVGIDGLDASVALGVNSSHIARMHGFAIESPADATNPVVFIETHDTAGVPDTFVIRSIEVTDGSTLMTAVAVTIAGANAPPDTNLMGTMSGPIASNKIMTFFQDDIYFGDITGDETGFTITYTDAKVTAFDVAVDVAATNVRKYSGYNVGTRVVLMRSDGPALSAMWELTTAGVLVAAFDPFTLAGLSNDLTDSLVNHAHVIAQDGDFAMLSPIGAGSNNQNAHYAISGFPLNDF